MRVLVTFRHLEADDALRDYAKEKVLKLRKYLERPMEARVVLSVEKFRKIAEATITGDGHTINGMEKTDDMHSAIDKLVGKLERQIRKLRGKTKPKRFGFSTQNYEHRMSASSSEGSEMGNEVAIVRDDDYSVKPMSIEEAVLQLSADENDFYVFINSDSGLVNVVYHRKDGNYGLIEPEIS